LGPYAVVLGLHFIVGLAGQVADHQEVTPKAKVLTSVNSSPFQPAVLTYFLMEKQNQSLEMPETPLHPPLPCEEIDTVYISLADQSGRGECHSSVVLDSYWLKESQHQFC
jgi:hypothetical protein